MEKHEFELEKFEAEGRVFTLRGAVDAAERDRDLPSLDVTEIVVVIAADDPDAIEVEVPLTESQREAFVERHRPVLVEALWDLWQAQRERQDEDRASR